MKNLYILIVILFISLGSFAQENQKNIVTKTYLTESGDKYLKTVQYYNNFGEETKLLQYGITPNHNNIEIKTEYNDLGEVVKRYLPTIKNRDIYGSENRLFEETKQDAFSTTVTRPGDDWQNHPVTTEYLTNSSNEVKYFTVTSNNRLKLRGFYPKSSLFKTVTTDEDGKKVTEYKDKLGRVVMQKQADDVYTYYVYNDLGQLVFVLPPLVQADQMPHSLELGETNETLKKYAYIYKYDKRGNQIYKKLPGCEPIFMAYNKADRLYVSQDGNQRKKTKITLHVYDRLGRPIYSIGIKNPFSSVQQIHSIFESNFGIERYIPDYQYKAGDTGYTNHNFCFDSKKGQFLTVNYYDNYDFLDLEVMLPYKSQLKYKDKQGYSQQYSSAKGLLTGTRTYLLDGSGDYTTKAIYYDNRGRVVQERSTNHLGGYDIVYYDLNFTGKPNKTLKEHSTNINHERVLKELYEYTYDHAGRIKSTTTYDYDQRPIGLSNIEYDELGRIKHKARHNGENIEEYEYNIQSWITKIKSGDFEEKIYYNNTTGLPKLYKVEEQCYNGNIAAIEWKYGSNWNGYRYKYDNLNRFYRGVNFSKTQPKINWYNSEFFEYDKQGNPTHIERHTPKSMRTDYISDIEYNGNQITKISDGGINQNLYNLKEYTDKSDDAIEMAYDTNGNLISDLDREIVTIRYNVLNLPDTIQFKNGNQIVNLYNANGEKLKTLYYTRYTPIFVPQSETVHHTANNYNDYYRQGIGYVDNKEYELNQWQYNGEWYKSIKKMYNSEGYTDYSSMTPRFCYYAKDHLGNIREVWRPAVSGTYYKAGVIQRTQYYPSGLPWYEGIGQGAQQRKYNGKEWVEAHGYDNYDYGARNYYPAIMRFTTIDPLAEKYYSVSPYAYCANNPVNRIDPDGMEVIAHGRLAQRNILNTLPFNVRSSVKFNKYGHLKIVNSYALMKSKSKNLSSLLKLNNSKIKYHFNVSQKYTDAEGELHKLVGENENGTKGITIFPKEKSKKSNDNVQIYTSDKLSINKQAENTAHEGYGHALSYEEGKDPYHRYKSVITNNKKNGFVFNRKDTNTELKNKIDIAIKEVKKTLKLYFY